MEAFNEAVQKWVPVDPLVTKSLAKPFKLEPPANDPLNAMNYVVAFEEDASARDVTRRYASAFSAKTRKRRVESTKDGEMWWERALGFYEKPFLEDRDQIEASELTSKTAAEPMPRNVQDFKDHPFFALKRHLRRNEAIAAATRPMGQVGAGKSGTKNKSLEPVYRRKDVHIVRSANGWYRLGRDIKLGEQPMKHVRAKRNNREADEDEDAGDDALETGLYAYFQTTPYEPPPVVDDQIPKNVYGNLDVYVPSMVPRGATHIRHRDAAQASRILGIDYAEAVTGFDFKGRHGTAVFDGVVIASEFGEALREVIHGLEDERLQAELEARSAGALALWKHFLLRLRIAERVRNYAVEGEETDVEAGASGGLNEDLAESGGGGGFFLSDSGQDAINRSEERAREQRHAIHRIGHSSPQATQETDEVPGGGFIAEDPPGPALQSAPFGTGLGRDSGTGKETPKRTLQSQPRFILKVSPNTKSKKPINRSPTRVYPGEYGPVQRQSGSVEAPQQAATMPQETTAIDSTGSCENPVPIESSTEGEPNVPSQSQSPKADLRGSDSDVEEVSLLSEDPEDEDAVPEWLM